MEGSEPGYAKSNFKDCFGIKVYLYFSLAEKLLLSSMSLVVEGVLPVLGKS